MEWYFWWGVRIVFEVSCFSGIMFVMIWRGGILREVFFVGPGTRGVAKMFVGGLLFSYVGARTSTFNL